MEALKLYEVKHPNRESRNRFEELIGLDHQKNQLLDNLISIFNPDMINQWQKKHHSKGLHVSKLVARSSPLIVLSGDVGCGKTELANCIGTPLSDQLNSIVRVFETPSDVRGTGMVGQLSARITAAFQQARSKLKPREIGILIIDEADDIATNRDQVHAHHEDRAGVNALIKEINRLREVPLVVILITNRIGAMDPAIQRRAAIDIQFSRPNPIQLREILEFLTEEINVTIDEINDLLESCKAKKPVFSFSDLFTRVAKQAILQAQREDKPYSVQILQETINRTKSSPVIDQS